MTTSVQKAIRILKCIEEHHEQGLRLIDICRLLDFEKPTVLRLLAQLTDEGLAMRHAKTKKYYLGDYCERLGQTLSLQLSLSTRYTPLLKRISARTEDASFLVVAQDLDTLCVAREVGSYPIQALAIPVGNRQPIGVGAGGLAMLSDFPGPVTEKYLKANQARFLNYKSLTLSAMRTRIENARKKGNAVIGSHAVNKVTGVGVSLRNKNGVIVGGISVAALDNRMTHKRQEVVAQIIKEEIGTFLG